MANIEFEDKWEFNEIVYGDHEDYRLIEDGEWEQDLKYQTRTIVVQHIPTGEYYMARESCFGSPFAGWECDTDSILYILYEVERVEETHVVVTWKPVKA